MTDLPVVSGSLCPDLSDDTRHFLTPVSAQKCLSGMCLASASEAQALIAAAHRLDNLIHHPHDAHGAHGCERDCDLERRFKCPRSRECCQSENS
jgi:hypothetical protein